MGIINFLKWLNAIRASFILHYPNKSRFGKIGKHSIIYFPIAVDYPQNVFISDAVRIKNNCAIINSPTEKVYIGKYTAIGAYSIFIPGNHRSTVTIPHFILGASHINDKSADLHIGEDVWCGARSVVLSGADLGRGCIVAANSVVNKPVPPYAVVGGVPAKILAVKFSIEQILEHEKVLYRENERFSKEYLESLFSQYFEDKKIFGTSDGIDGDARKRLEHIKKITGFTDWTDTQ